jgi:internalin A
MSYVLAKPEYSWNKSHNLILRYKYDFMPKGILTRLIVETNPWIEEQKLVWKNGVVLNKDETRVEVIENYNQREIKVSVSGNRKKELLAVVTHELDKIHRSFERLQYQTLVPCNCSECDGSENPYAYPLESLRKRLKAGKYQVECDRSYESVDVRRLIDDVNLPIERDYREAQTRDTPLQRELEREKNKSLNVSPVTKNIKLSGQQRKQLHDALMDAFPNKSSLEQLLSYELDKNLDEIASGNDLQEVVFNIIKIASAEGWIGELICAAKEYNPGNSLLNAIVL